MIENKNINMKKEHYEKLDEIDLKMERLCSLQSLLGKRIFSQYCDNAANVANGNIDEIDNEENEESCALSDQIAENLKEIRNTISTILKDAQVI